MTWTQAWLEEGHHLLSLRKMLRSRIPSGHGVCTSPTLLAPEPTCPLQSSVLGHVPGLADSTRPCPPWVSVLGPYSERLLPDVLLLLSSYVLFRQLLSFRLWLLHLQPGSDAQIRLSDVLPREGRRGLKALCSVWSTGRAEGLKATAGAPGPPLDTLQGLHPTGRLHPVRRLLPPAAVPDAPATCTPSLPAAPQTHRLIPTSTPSPPVLFTHIPPSASLSYSFSHKE